MEGAWTAVLPKATAQLAATDAPTRVSAVRLGGLQRGHRGRLREILDATAVFRPDEVDVALELFDQSLLDERGPLSAGEQVSRAGSRIQSPDYEFVGLFDDSDRLVGYACFGPTPGTDRTYDLYWIAMHPTLHGHGGGSRLLEEVEERLRARGARLLAVETSSRDDYTRTRRFYEARGYVEAARLRGFYAPGDDRVIYTKRLAVGSSSYPLSERGVRDE